MACWAQWLRSPLGPRGCVLFSALDAFSPTFSRPCPSGQILSCSFALAPLVVFFSPVFFRPCPPGHVLSSSVLSRLSPWPSPLVFYRPCPPGHVLFSSVPLAKSSAVFFRFFLSDGPRRSFLPRHPKPWHSRLPQLPSLRAAIFFMHSASHVFLLPPSSSR